MRFACADLMAQALGVRGPSEHGAWRRAAAILALLLAALSFAALVRADTTNAGALAAAAERCVREAFGPSVEVETQCGPVPPLGAFQGTEPELRPRILGERHAAGPVLVSVELWRDGQRLGERPVTVLTRLYQRVLVAREPVARGAALSPEQFVVERRQVNSPVAGGAPSVESVTGMRLRRAVPAGEVVQAADLEPMPLVHRGDKVSATVGIGAITITMSAVALQDGAAGATVDVKNDRSGRRLRAIVVAPGSVRVLLDDPAIGG